MKKTSSLALLLLAVVAAGPALSFARSAAQSSATTASVPLVSPADDDFAESDPNAPDLRVVVAAPRAAITGKLGSVLTRMRLGRTIHAIAGDTVRFVAGLKEAVWYSGAGRVQSDLRIVRQDPNGPVALGDDHLTVSGSAPKVDSGRTRVDVNFPSVGSFPVTALVGVTAVPRNGTGVNRSNRVPYTVQVWNAGDLGEITGTVTDASDGSPLEGFRVVALDPVLGALESVSYTACDGTYDLKRLPPAGYVVAVRGQAGFHQEFYVDTTDPNAATPVAVTAGTATSSVDFHLSR